MYREENSMEEAKLSDKRKRHENREDSVGEHIWGDLGQIILLKHQASLGRACSGECVIGYSVNFRFKSVVNLTYGVSFFFATW